MAGATMQRGYRSMPEVAEHLGVSLSTVRRRVAEGTIPASRLGRGRRVLIALDDVDASVRLSRGLTSALDPFGRALDLDASDAWARSRAALEALDRLDAAPAADPGGLDDLLAALATDRGEGVGVAP